MGHVKFSMLLLSETMRTTTKFTTDGLLEVP
jgi:hypothetical protein